MLSKFRYYTGIIFQAYTYGTGEPLIKGGRYNELMKHFGKPASSIGFAIVVDNLMLALSRQKLTVPAGDKTIVITYDPVSYTHPDVYTRQIQDDIIPCIRKKAGSRH